MKQNIRGDDRDFWINYIYWKLIFNNFDRERLKEEITCRESDTLQFLRNFHLSPLSFLLVLNQAIYNSTS